MKRFTTLIIFLISALAISAQTNKIFKENIASLQVVANNNPQSMPIINLYDDSKINISFDELTNQYHNYTYSIKHCEANWQPSDNLFSSEYIEGFAENNIIDNITPSKNTNTQYTHYEIQIPNQNCKIKMSGNYIITIYQDDNNDKPILQAYFYVVEPIANVNLYATSHTDIDINNKMQQISMQLNLNNIPIKNANKEIKTIVLQNQRTDNAIVNAKPTEIMPTQIRWHHQRQLIFLAGNEYRKFEILDNKKTTMGVEKIIWDGKQYHAYLYTDEPRENYIFDKDTNGAFYIRNSDNIENNNTSDYTLVHFKLKSQKLQQNVFINAKWTNWQINNPYQMEYNYTQQAYTATILLKQGYYSYQYLTKDNNGNTSFLNTEGSFYQTENTYHALIYYKPLGAATDRLIAYNKIKING